MFTCIILFLLLCCSFKFPTACNPETSLNLAGYALCSFLRRLSNFWLDWLTELQGAKSVMLVFFSFWRTHAAGRRSCSLFPGVLSGNTEKITLLFLCKLVVSSCVKTNLKPIQPNEGGHSFCYLLNYIHCIKWMSVQRGARMPMGFSLLLSVHKYYFLVSFPFYFV